MIKLESVKIRDATIDDLNHIVDIYNSTIPGRMVTADTEPITAQSREKWFYEHSHHFRPLWVMEYDKQICGWISFQSFYGRPAYNATVEISIYVSEKFRGNGLGRNLLERAIEICPSLGIKTILAFVFGHNKPSLSLFNNFGFHTWGNFPGVAELDGIERDLLILGKRIQ